MANTLKFKRGLVSTIPTAALGEPLFTTDTFDLYIGNGTGNTRFQKYIASGATTQILRGDGSLYTFPLNISSPSNGQVLKYNGTNWVNDSDSGITGSGVAGQVAYFTGATTLGGGNNFFWDSSNNRLGLATNTPSYRLHIVGNGYLFGLTSGGTTRMAQLFSNTGGGLELGIEGSAGGTIFTNASAYASVIGSNNATSLQFATNASVRATLTANGRLLLGTTTEGAQLLQVNGTARIVGATTLVGGAIFQATTITQGFAIEYQSAAPARFYNSTNSVSTDVYHNGTYLVFGGATRTSSTAIFDGSVGIGTTSLTGISLRVAKTMTGAVNAVGIYNDGQVQSDVTTAVRMYRSQLNIVNSTFTIPDVYHYLAEQGTIGASSSVTNQYGYITGDLSKGTNNYAFYGSLSAGTGKWNLYMNGTAANYINGNLLLGSTTDSGEKFQVTGTMKVTGASTFYSTVEATSSTTSGKISINGGQTSARQYLIQNVITGISNAGFEIRDVTGGFTPFAIAASGAATFSSSVTATNLTLTDAGGGIINNITGNLLFQKPSSGGFIFRNGSPSFTEYMRLSSIGNLGIGTNNPDYKLDVTGQARVSDAIAIGTTPDTNKPFKILKAINSTVGINFENTSTGSSAFSAIQFGTDVTGATAFGNLVYASSGITEAGVYKPSGTALINTGSGGLNFLSVSQPIRFFTSTGNGTERVRITNDGDITQYNGTNPSASTTDAYRQYSADVTAGNAAPHFRTENGAVIKLYQETTGVGNAIISLGGGNAVLDDTTFDGYTLRQIVRALRNQGILQ